jgi:hypothetical protein
MRQPTRTDEGFTVVELVAVIGVSVLLAVCILLAGSDQRRLGRLGDDLVKLKTIGGCVGQYSADNADLCFSFSWVHAQSYQSQYPDLNNATDDVKAAANQAVYILRTRANRPDIPAIPAWIPHIQYSHLVLADYLDQRLPWKVAISSADRDRQNWASDPACFDQACFACQPAVGPEAKRWPYSGSFQLPTMYYDRSVAGARLNQTGLPHGFYNYYPTTTALGPARMSDVAFPSQKVLMHDINGRHFGTRQPYCTHPEARLPLLMVDGSVPVRSAADANPGWDPNVPSSPTLTMQFTYQPLGCWEPPALNPGGDLVFGRFRYTRQSLFGRDFGGPEVP